MKLKGKKTFSYSEYNWHKVNFVFFPFLFLTQTTRIFEFIIQKVCGQKGTSFWSVVFTDHKSSKKYAKF